MPASASAQLMWAALADLQHQLEEDEDLIEYKTKKNLVLSAAFFLNGRNEYSQATLLTAELLLTRAAAATLGPDFDAARYATLRDAFLAARAGPGAGDEQSAKAHAEVAGHRQALTDAVKLVAAHRQRDETRAAAYFRIELVQAPASEQP